ncbi:Aspartic proteinase nepenthesin-1 [Dichanthelium oligosanthes]|uniref:Aspartic proteinase nepenthesin-1 n=1 Tax=Dichanthelium oligosanthes TaxID=888268 RepID=A0A1E5WLG8_9POAL|nr:Aspartic proteinase nepenthesin-1 [Dichanthelium oligosanthes]
MLARSRARAASLHQCGSGHHYGKPVTVSLAPGIVGTTGEYLVHFGIGMPRPQPVALTMDTGSDLIWTQCASCGACFDQPYPLFDPSASKTIGVVPCSDPICAASGLSGCYVKKNQCFYFTGYGDGTISAGGMFRDTFTFKAPSGKGGPVVMPSLSFGCGKYNKGLFISNDSGIAGFGRGPQSLPSQLKVGKFSHCFTSVFNPIIKSSPMFLGTPDDLRSHAMGPIQSTPMIQNRERPTFYYLPLKGIAVGKKRLPIKESAFAIKKDGSGGTIIDSGTSVTTFPQAVYEQLRSEFVAQVPLPVVANSSAYDLCFSTESVADPNEVPLPKLVFNLEGADIELPPANFMATFDGPMMCLIIDNGKGDDMAIIGNFQQQNMHIVYDVEDSKLLFVRAQCDEL